MISTAGQGWSEFLPPGKRTVRAYTAFAVINKLASVIPFAPNPGSPATTPASIPTGQNDPGARWHNLFAEDCVVQHYDSAANQEASNRLFTTQSRAQSDSVCGSSRAPPPPQRALTSPFPTGSNRESIFEPSQYVFIDRRSSGLFDSPIPVNPGFDSVQDTAPAVTEHIPTTIEGLSDFCETIRQCAELSHETDVSSEDEYFSLDFPSNIREDSMDVFHTPTSHEFPSETVGRKLLVIGSNYECKRASTAFYRQSLKSLHGTNLDAKSLKSAFRRRAYTVETLVGNQFDRDTVLEKVTSFLQSEAKPGDVRAIVFTGHAYRMFQGTVALVPPLSRGEEDLIPGDLWERTIRENTKPGVIVLSIFASCMSGALMRQQVNLKDLNSAAPSDPVSPDTPIFVTFASSEEDQRSYESTIGFDEDKSPRTGDHFLRALTLTARERNVTDWQSFIETMQEKFDQLRLIGAYCAEITGSDSGMTYESWLERSPQQPVISASQLHLPPFESVFPSEISLVDAPRTPLDKQANLAEEFLAHIQLRGEFPEISHFTFSSTNDIVAPV
ncbi:hypothetical protein FRC09_010656 [Ceratobasidium sp. 395]|nr:hypothetical protein FRC09_010656 [Ceratobasidium sp. 395]